MNVRPPVTEDTDSDVALTLAEVIGGPGTVRVSSSGLPSLLISRLCVLSSL